MPDWWDRIRGEISLHPSEELRDANERAAYEEARLDALELRIQVIENRLGITREPGPDRKPA